LQRYQKKDFEMKVRKTRASVYFGRDYRKRWPDGGVPPRAGVESDVGTVELRARRWALMQPAEFVTASGYSCPLLSWPCPSLSRVCRASEGEQFLKCSKARPGGVETWLGVDTGGCGDASIPPGFSPGGVDTGLDFGWG
jgi:hypothetical protein